MKVFKIKDSVDLRVLKDYGFNLESSSIEGIGTFDWSDNYVDDNYGTLNSDGDLISINDQTRILWCHDDNELLFRLIIDGLIEVKEIENW